MSLSDGDHRQSFTGTPLFFALAVWLCTLPAVLLIASRFFSWETTWYLVGAVLAAELAACWVMCRLPAGDHVKEKK